MGKYLSLARRVYPFVVNSTELGFLLYPFILHRLKKRLCDIKDIRDVVNFTFSFKCLGLSILRPIQFKYEITTLLEMISISQRKVILEIGSAVGGTLFIFTRMADPDATIISIDLPRGSSGGGYPKWKKRLYKSFVKKGQRMHLMRADSHDPKTLEKVDEVLNGEKIDLLFIDGDHTYEGVKKDFEMYAPYVNRGGIIALHDIVPYYPPRLEVSKFWNEIKHRYDYREIVEDWNQIFCGIGILYT